MNQFAFAALRLKILHTALSAALERAQKAKYENMKQIAKGIWIHKKYSTLKDAIADLPQPSN